MGVVHLVGKDPCREPRLPPLIQTLTQILALPLPCTKSHLTYLCGRSPSTAPPLHVEFGPSKPRPQSRAEAPPLTFPAGPARTASRPRPGPAHLGLRQLSLEQLQRLRVLPLAVLKGLKLLLQLPLQVKSPSLRRLPVSVM